MFYGCFILQNMQPKTTEKLCDMGVLTELFYWQKFATMYFFFPLKKLAI